MQFRMSRQSDKADSKPPSISIPQKDAIAIVPPKKVRDPSPNSGYLAFTQGDFLHVVGRENDEDWYEACNPLQGTRGLVPVKYFSIVNKNMRDSQGSAGSGPRMSGGGGHDSGYAGENSNSPPAMMNGMVGMVGMAGLRMSKSMGKGGGVYGVVIYDFKAERPDELDAKEGEAILVIAQSNPEWFVAKPITRLGGPGLIPVSFIEIRDMTTGQAMPDPVEAVKRAGVPKVEEWKKMAADYKNGSISLGKLGGDATQDMQQGMARMSLQSQQTQFTSNGGYGQGAESQPSPYGAYPNMNQQSYQDEIPLIPVKASVPRYCFADDIFWFIVECQMEDGRHWELSRLYQDFYDLQINLIQEFPREAGNVEGYERSLPFMPGPVTYVTDNISNGRRANLDEYIRKLLKLGPKITQSYLVRRFFAPRKGDYEIDPTAPDGYRLSSSSHQSVSPDLGSAVSSVGNLSNPSVAATAFASQPSGYPAHQRNQSSLSNSQGLMSPPPSQQPPNMLRNNSSLSALTQTTTGSSSTAATPAPIPMASGTAQPATKIKVFFSPDDVIVVKMPPIGQFRWADLYKRIKERRMEGYGDDGGIELAVSYRDEREGKMFALDGDEDLRVALERNARLALDVRVVR
ncbi:hypothetical protein NA57DRAFT_46730 [Rhizodiscina lignyota]|uniref:Bud emergence protein 1 n=1 Tax=Rhizodiscina lignyota TaxID=1504668 RepID=A0A9P4I3C9_9PEZI|nr:hypothetical protein NA57DRAFT_46730 [Rhizodiscina lignyota]